MQPRPPRFSILTPTPSQTNDQPSQDKRTEPDADIRGKEIRLDAIDVAESGAAEEKVRLLSNALIYARERWPHTPTGFIAIKFPVFLP